MKAVLLDKPGPPSSLRTGEIPTPRLGHGTSGSREIREKSHDV